MRLSAPFPWFGGKSRAAHLIWPRFGDVPNYVEPFAGSLAVLLARPHPPNTETINDLDCYVANFWRAVQHDPAGVATFADWPVNEADLLARHEWLVNLAGFRQQMRSDAYYYSPKIAGWWVWGLCCWIGSGWCRERGDGHTPEQLPHLGNAGMGIHRSSCRTLGTRGWAYTGASCRTLGTRGGATRFARGFKHSLTGWLVFAWLAGNGIACSAPASRKSTG